MNADSQLSHSDALSTITEKRRALESLIKIAASVENQQSALSELALAAKPSQEFPAKVVSYFAAIEKRLKDTDSTGLLHKLETIEKKIGSSVNKILKLAKIDINKLRDSELENINIESFGQFIDDFKRRTNTSLALRFILKKRGMAIAPIKLPIQQETVNEQIAFLKEKEIQCVKQVRKEIQAIIKDTSAILLQPNLPEPMKEELEQVNKAMLVNLEHLDRGGTVKSLPNVFEIVTLETESYDSGEVNERTPPEDNRETQEKVDEQPEPEQKTESRKKEVKAKTEEPEKEIKSYWWIFKKWLSSPWSTSWRSLKAKYRP
ncbi:hypothetical protein [Aliikangiella sp. G2MR2-5]|uniref:hypothetical protein n=1 Tax=Aliikangiella sp. G2MR2-5 TaxID=2788943 RepID=UPI0018A9EF4B|nr:hypothetical protein [Aliikangiella sp. G2MR2-5]